LKREIYLVPHSLTEIAEILIDDYCGSSEPNEKTLEQAKELLTKAKEFNDYDFDKPLMRRIAKSIDRFKSLLLFYTVITSDVTISRQQTDSAASKRRSGSPKRRLKSQHKKALQRPRPTLRSID